MHPPPVAASQPTIVSPPPGPPARSAPAPLATAAPPAASSAAIPAPFQLVVVDPPDAKGQAFPLGRDGQVDVTVGRAAGCGLALTQDTFVSQLHARIFRADGTWQIEDLGSTNGTFLNRRKVSAPQALHPGDRIQVGRTVLEVTR
jgi:pSer/pThr/pTyr-binding forkhead associated (FHA) protein